MDRNNSRVNILPYVHDGTRNSKEKEKGFFCGCYINSFLQPSISGAKYVVVTHCRHTTDVNLIDMMWTNYKSPLLYSFLNRKLLHGK